MTRKEILDVIACGGNLRGADLRGADLREADLRGVNLRELDLRGLDLRGLDLRGMNLRGLDLRGLDLRGADLRGADLRGADLRGADLRGADLRGLDLRGASGLLMLATPPEEDSFIAYKKVDGVVLTLKIPAGAKRTGSYVGRKCRAEYVITLTPGVRGLLSAYDEDTTYTTGVVTKADSYNDDPRLECTNGIHFFMTRQEAEDY
jgi:uncharacterized protein YjbI with pentapeptide repeats